MIYNPRLDPPKDSTNPHSMRVVRVVPWNGNAIVVDVEVTHGSTTTIERCVTRRNAELLQWGCRTRWRSDIS
jgi:hypothetical protein